LCDAHPHRRTSLGSWRTLPQSPSTVRTKREVRNRRSAGCPAPRSRPENGPISTTAESAPSRLIPLLGGLVHGQMKTDDPRLFRFHFQGGIRFALPDAVHRKGSDRLAFFHHLRDRKSTRLNSSHVKICYAVLC